MSQSHIFRNWQVFLAVSTLSLLAIGAFFHWNNALPGSGSDIDNVSESRKSSVGEVGQSNSVLKTGRVVVESDGGIREGDSMSPLGAVTVKNEQTAEEGAGLGAAGVNPFAPKLSAMSPATGFGDQALLSEYSPVDAEDSLSSEKTPSINLASNLLEVALSEPEAESVNRASIHFSLTPTPGIHLLPVPASTAPSTVVYAHVIAEQRCLSCILKWEHMESRTIHFLAPKSLSPESVATVFITPQEGWQPGTYELSVYESAESPLFIGRGTTIISGIDINQPTMVPPVEFLQSLLDNGLAHPKVRVN